MRSRFEIGVPKVCYFRPDLSFLRRDAELELQRGHWTTTRRDRNGCSAGAKPKFGQFIPLPGTFGDLFERFLGCRHRFSVDSV